MTRPRGSGHRTRRGSWAALAMAAALLASATTASTATATATVTGEGAATAGAAPRVKEPNPVLTAASFANPPAVDRPKYRWWLPVADESDAELRSQLGQIAAAGAGGAEVTAFPAPNAPGSTLHSSEPYLSTYGYGTALWSHRVQVMETEAAKDGLILDLAAGPRWPPTVPSVAGLNQPQVAQQVLYGREFDAPGSTRAGALPATLVPPPSVIRTLCGRVAAGAGTVLLDSTRNLAAGDRIALGPAGATGTATATGTDVVTVRKVGTSSPCTTLAGATGAGATRVVTATTDTNLVAGVTVTIGSGADQDTATIRSAGGTAGSTTLSAATTAGATTLVLSSVAGIEAGDTLTVDPGAAVESARVSAVDPATRQVTVRTALGAAHPPGAAVSDAGQDLTFTTALAHAHAAGERIVAPGTGVTVTPVGAAHAVGERAVDTAAEELVAVEVAQCATACDASTAPVSLDRSSVTDVTGKLDARGGLSYTFPQGNGRPWVVLDFYQTADGQAATNVSPTGSAYVLDHLSADGATALTDFWDRNILADPAVKDAIARTARTAGTPAIFEDSLELSDELTWTWDFPDRFRQSRGYSVDQALPALAGFDARRVSGHPVAFTYSDGQSARMVRDYEQTFSDLYGNRYLTALESWAEANGLTVRAQAYGAPIDAAEADTHVGIPEGEGFEFNGKNPDQDFKVIAAGADRTGATIVSGECCAIKTQVWATTAAQNLTSEVYVDMAGGDNQIVWHGMPYPTAPAGSGAGSVWPGFSYGGNTSFSEAWGPRMPQWRDARALNDDIARMSLVLRQGRPSYDVGVYYQNVGLAGQAYDDPASVVKNTSAMAAAGYTYGYADSAFLTDASKDYRDGVLFPGASDYHALVLDDPRSLKAADATQILALARAGLPVVVIGPAAPAAMATPGYDAGPADRSVQADWNALYALAGEDGATAKAAGHHVVRVDAEAAVPGALARLGITPAAAHTGDPTSGALLDVRRDDGATQYYYLYNNSARAVDQRLTLTGKGTPYALNTWTGAVTPLAQYAASGGAVTLDVRLGAHDATVVAVSTDTGKFGTGPGPVAATATTADRAVFDAGGGLAIESSRPGTFRTTLSDGRTAGTAITDVPAASTLANWQLTVDSWTPGRTGAPGDTAHTTIGPIAVSADPGTGALPAWTAVTKAAGHPVDLQDVAGTADYTTHLTLPPGWTGGRHAFLDLGRVTDTAEVTVNGTALPPVDFADPSRIDLGNALRSGDNTLTVHVATPLVNAVRVAPGTGASGRTRTGNGLLGPVVLTPYGRAAVTTG
ncbi:glycosyl hydrolase [Streptomyces sp. NBC_00448]|uniref:glycosyl hydrolase n=1 Tax=Streptomyces sp. NBC_00448 TaxID=2903652 RepID=UPI002E223C7F